MTKHIAPVSFRGVSPLGGVRADADLIAAINKFEKDFTSFKASNDEAIKNLKKGYDDVVKRDEVDKINNALSEQLTEINAKIREAAERQAALEAGGAGAGSGKDPMKALQQFSAVIRSRRGEAENKFDGGSRDPVMSLEDYQNYERGFETYARRGEKQVPSAIMASMSVGSDSEGGYTVPADTSGRIVTKIYESSPMRQVCSVTTIGTDRLEGYNDLEEASVGWVGEEQTRSETGTPGIGKWEIPVHELYAMPKVTQKLLDDSMWDIEGWLANKVGTKMGREETSKFLTGTGAGQPKGLLTYTTVSTADASRAWGQFQYIASGSTSAVAADPLITTVFSLKAAYRQNAAWAMNRSTLSAIRKLKDGQDNYLWQPDFTVRQGGTLLGHSIVEMEDMPDIAANALSIAFGDWAETYQIVDRAGITLLRDPFTEKGFIKLYSRKRVGGAAINSESMKFMKFAAS